MGCTSGTQVVLCNLPVRFDTYKGCSHGCKYCFTKKKWELEKIGKAETVEGLRNFVEGGRGLTTNWCDWGIPIHWGGMSDPFQPIEKEIRNSYTCLKYLAETGYPFVVSTKGKLIAEKDYLELLAASNCVLQISMVCSKYDRLEPGAPKFEERLAVLQKVAPKVKRAIVRIQPYMPEVEKDVLENLPRFAEAGAHGVILEGMKFWKSKPGLTKIGADICYPLGVLQPQFETIKRECHRVGLKFYSGENRLRSMGDSMCCCGIDGLDGFKGNDYNICMIMNKMEPEPTERMQEVGTASCFKSMYQSAGTNRPLDKNSFCGIMQKELSEKREYYKKVFGISE